MSEQHHNAHFRLMEQASRYRDDLLRGSNDDFTPRWECGRGHAWDDALDFAQNVRCMNCAGQRRELEMRRLRELAEVRGGALLSTSPVSGSASLAWQCAYGHIWNARADAASRYWCAECARNLFAHYR